MREYGTPMNVDVPDTGNLTDHVVANARSFPIAVAFSRRVGEALVPVTTEQFLTEVRAVAKGLVAAGVGQGDRVALMSKTRYEWTLIDYAIWFAGAVSVPIYETASAEQVEWILTDSGATLVTAETDAHRNRILASRSLRKAEPQVWVIDDAAVEKLVALGRDIADEELEHRRTSLTPKSVATLIYTSGTTGRPKACMLTHGNFMFELTVAVEELHELFEPDEAATLLFLPLAHVFARVIQVGAVKARVRLGHSGEVQRLVEDLQEFGPTFILAVPRVFEKLFNTASQNAAANGRGRLFEAAADTAIAYSRSLDDGNPGALLRLRHGIYSRLVYRRLRDALGGSCRYAVSGGAPLGERLGHFYRGIGITVLEGYGMTETSGAATVNVPSAAKIGTVGRPLPGTSFRIAEDGEVLVKGDQVMAGYWQNAEATKQILDSAGWLHTGDLGEIDEEGFVTITGRKTEILVTAGGKNVAPTVLEDRLRAHPLVGQCMVVGDGRPFIAALITLDLEAASRWSAQHGRSGELANLVRDPLLREEIQAAVDAANQAVSKAESIRKFEILPTVWSEESGHLTPSLKLKRNVVGREHRTQIQRLYES